MENEKDNCCLECRFKKGCRVKSIDCAIAKEKRNFQYYMQRRQTFSVRTETSTKKGKGH